jgi:ornithine carbamoyltransferase
MNSFKGRDFLTLADYSVDEVAAVLDRAAEVKKNPGAFKKSLDGKTLAMIFEKPSLRTRVTFETGMTQLHGHAIYISPGDAGLGTRESIPDVARNLERWVEGIMARVFAHSKVEQLAQWAGIPVINGLSDDHHPVQALADVMTIREAAGGTKGFKLAYVGDGNNVTHSLLQAAALTGMSISVATPERYEPRKEIVAWSVEAGRKTGCKVEITHDIAAAVKGAHFIYTDVWASMGQEAEAEARRKIFLPYQVNARIMKLAGTDPWFLHCLPAHRGDEVTDEVADASRSLIFQQAENRLHAQKALLVMLMGE